MMVSVIIPTYREAENIRVIVPMIARVLKDARMEVEIIVADDNSPDGTAQVAAELARGYPVRVHVRREERGLATAVVKGFDLASGDILVVMDADLSHPVEKIPDMVRPILDDRCDITVGSRYVKGGGCDNWPLPRRMISRFSGLMARGVTKLSDPTSGFMAVRRTVLDRAVLDPAGWKIVLEVVVKTRARVEEVPIVFADREKGESKLSTRVQAQYIAHLLRLYRFRYRQLFDFVKFCITGLIGLFVDTAVLVAFVELAGFDPGIAAVFPFLPP